MYARLLVILYVSQNFLFISSTHIQHKYPSLSNIVYITFKHPSLAVFESSLYLFCFPQLIEKEEDLKAYHKTPNEINTIVKHDPEHSRC